MRKSKACWKRVDYFSPKLASVDVRWSMHDSEGQEKSSEISHYLIHEGKDGHPRIQVALSMAEP